MIQRRLVAQRSSFWHFRKMIKQHLKSARKTAKIRLSLNFWFSSLSFFFITACCRRTRVWNARQTVKVFANSSTFAARTTSAKLTCKLSELINTPGQKHVRISEISTHYTLLQSTISQHFKREKKNNTKLLHFLWSFQNNLISDFPVQSRKLPGRIFSSENFRPPTFSDSRKSPESEIRSEFTTVYFHT